MNKDRIDEIHGEWNRYTHENGGVYYEAGFAMGLGIPVIRTHRKGQEIHFDTRQYFHIEWETPAELRKRLGNQIKATVPPPAT